jgi:hypothetical protein
MSDLTEGTRVILREWTYEWDGADWHCPSMNHDPSSSGELDAALAEIVRLQAAIPHVQEARRLAGRGYTNTYALDKALEALLR